MSLSNIGTYEVSRGQLITLFTENPDGRNHKFTLIYVKKSFNMSEKMVEYYNSLKPDEKTQSSEDSSEGLYRMLLKQGLVEKPRSDFINMGNVGRPSSRLADEVRYSRNPESFLFERIQDDLLYSTRIFFNHQNYRVLLLGAGSSLNEAIIDVHDEDGVIVWSFKIGIVFDGTVDLTLNDDDTNKLRETVKAMIRETGYLEPLELGKINYNFSEFA